MVVVSKNYVDTELSQKLDKGNIECDDLKPGCILYNDESTNESTLNFWDSDRVKRIKHFIKKDTGDYQIIPQTTGAKVIIGSDLTVGRKLTVDQDATFGTMTADTININYHLNPIQISQNSITLQDDMFFGLNFHDITKTVELGGGVGKPSVIVSEERTTVEGKLTVSGDTTIDGVIECDRINITDANNCKLMLNSSSEYPTVFNVSTEKDGAMNAADVAFHCGISARNASVWEGLSVGALYYKAEINIGNGENNSVLNHWNHDSTHRVKYILNNDTGDLYVNQMTGGFISIGSDFNVGRNATISGNLTVSGTINYSDSYKITFVQDQGDPDVFTPILNDDGGFFDSNKWNVIIQENNSVESAYEKSAKIIVHDGKWCFHSYTAYNSPSTYYYYRHVDMKLAFSKKTGYVNNNTGCSRIEALEAKIEALEARLK